MKQATFLVAIVVGLAVALGLVTGGAFLGPAPDVNLHSYSDGAWTGGGCSGNKCGAGGENPPGGPGNLIDQSEFIASWSPNLIGQRVTITPGILAPGFALGCGIDKFHINLDLLDWGGKDQKVINTDVSVGGITLKLSGWTPITTSYWDIVPPDGKTVIPEGAKVRAEFLWHCFLGSWWLGASQISILHTGIGDIHRNQDQVKVGDVASWTYQVGYVSDQDKGLGWSFYVTSGAQGGRTVFGPVTLTQTDGTFSYTVTDADFSTSSRSNELHAYLRNELWSKAFDITTTITEEQLAHAPSCEIESVSPQSPKQGESVTVSFGCSPASAAAEDAIDRIKVTWGYGSDDHSNDLAPTETSYQFVAGESGYARLLVIAYTVNNVPSATKSVDIQVDHQVSNQFRAAGDLIPLIAAAIVVVVGLIVATGIGKGKPLWFLLIFLGFAAVAVFAYFALGGGG